MFVDRRCRQVFIHIVQVLPRDFTVFSEGPNKNVWRGYGFSKGDSPHLVAVGGAIGPLGPWVVRGVRVKLGMGSAKSYLANPTVGIPRFFTLGADFVFFFQGSDLIRYSAEKYPSSPERTSIITELRKQAGPSGTHPGLAGWVARTTQSTNKTN